MRTAPVFYLRHLVDLVAASGADIDPWLANAGLTKEKLDDGSVRLPIDKFKQLMTDAVVLSGETGIGLLVGRKLDLGSHGVLGLAGATSATLQEALTVVKEFLPLRTQLATIDSVWDGPSIQLRFEAARGLAEVGPMVVEVVITAIKQVADLLVEGESPCEEVCFSWPEPPHGDLAREVLNCPVRFNQTWTGARVSAARASEPLPLHDPIAHSEAVGVCRQQLAQLLAQQSVGARLEWLLSEEREEPPTLNDAAQRLNMTPRTLHRRLEEEGASYKSILDDVRRQFALECLLIQQLSVKETAARLGYSDVASFRRAFKRWEGDAPSVRRGR